MNQSREFLAREGKRNSHTEVLPGVKVSDLSREELMGLVAVLSREVADADLKQERCYV